MNDRLVSLVSASKEEKTALAARVET